VVETRCRGRPPRQAGAGRGSSGPGASARTIPGAGTANGRAVPRAKRGEEELGPGAAQVVPREGESAVLPEAVANELRADVQEDPGVRGADREPDRRPDERVLGPLRRARREERGLQEGRGEGRTRQRHQTVSARLGYAKTAALRRTSTRGWWAAVPVTASASSRVHRAAQYCARTVNSRFRSFTRRYFTEINSAVVSKIFSFSNFEN